MGENVKENLLFTIAIKAETKLQFLYVPTEHNSKHKFRLRVNRNA